MLNAKRIGRLSMLAVGLGIGATVAATPGTAAPDTSTDPFSWIGGMDLGDLSAPAQTTTSNIAISVDGFSLLQEGNAFASSGPGEIAIAMNGGNAFAAPGGGIFDFAFADGTGAGAVAGVSPLTDAFDFAFADGANSEAVAGLGSFDSAFADGANSAVFAGGALEPTGPIFGSFDLAAAFGDMLHAIASGGNFLTDIVP